MQNKPLQNSENNFLDLLNFIIDPAVVVNETGRILLTNNALEDITGLNAKEVIGKIFLEVDTLTAESKAIMLKNLKKRMQGLSLQPYEIAFTNKNGELAYAEIKAKKISYAGQPADLVIFHDITRRKKNLAKLNEYSERMEALVEEKVKEIKDSEEKFRNLAELSPHMVFVNKKGRVVYANKSAEEVMGYTKEEFYSPSFNFLCLIAPESRELVKSVYEKHLKEGKNVGPLDYRLVTKDGRVLDAILTSRLIMYEGDYAVLGSVIDITKRKEAEAKLEKALCETYKRQTQVEALLECSSAVHQFSDFKSAAQVIFNSCKKLIGATAGYVALLSENLMENETLFLDSGGLKCTVDPNLPMPVRGLREKAYRTGEPVYENEFAESECMKFLPAGHVELKNVLFVPLMLNGKAVGLMGLANKLGGFTEDDATIAAAFGDFNVIALEKSRAWEALKDSEEQLRAITNSAKDAIILIDEKGVTRFWSKSAEKLFGYSSEEAIGKNLHILLAPSMLSEVAEKGLLKFKGSEHPAYEGRNLNMTAQTKDGKELPVEVSITALWLKGKRHFVGIVRDIAERVEMQRKIEEYTHNLEKIVQERTKQLKTANEQLLKSQRLAAIGELAGMVGHDLRNPLTGIKGAIYYLETKCAARIGATGKMLLETIDKAIEHSNKIINDLLAYSSKLSLALSETTPKLLLKKALASIEVPERIQIIDATKGKPKIKADIESMRKVFVNLITNAIDAMPEAGTLTITSKAVKGNVKIIFKDTGTGMTEETLSKLKLGFPLFTTKAKGMGFGLPICKRIVEAHGGKISLKSALGKGTAITITIPVNPKPVKEGEEKWIFNESVLQALRATEKTP